MTIVSPIRALRKKLGLSQDKLAQMIGKTRAFLLRLENKPWHRLSLGEIESISKAVNMTADEMIRVITDFRDEACINRVAVNNNGKPGGSFQIQFDHEVNCTSLLPHPDLQFVGIVEIGPKKSWFTPSLPEGNRQVYWVLEGILNVIMLGRETIIKTNEAFSTHAVQGFEFFNPDSLKSLKILVSTTPAIVRC